MAKINKGEKMSYVNIPLAGIMSSISNDGCWHDLGPDGSIEQLAGMDIVDHFGSDTITTPERAPHVLDHLLSELEYRISEGWIASEINKAGDQEWQCNTDMALAYMTGNGCGQCSAWTEPEVIEDGNPDLVWSCGEEFAGDIHRNRIRDYFIFEQCSDCETEARKVIAARNLWEELQDVVGLGEDVQEHINRTVSKLLGKKYQNI
jgi:bacterioferritin-associated ferredoxin